MNSNSKIRAITGLYNGHHVTRYDVLGIVGEEIRRFSCAIRVVDPEDQEIEDAMAREMLRREGAKFNVEEFLVPPGRSHPDYNPRYVAI